MQTSALEIDCLLFGTCHWEIVLSGLLDLLLAYTVILIKQLSGTHCTTIDGYPVAKCILLSRGLAISGGNMSPIYILMCNFSLVIKFYTGKKQWPLVKYILNFLATPYRSRLETNGKSFNCKSIGYKKYSFCFPLNPYTIFINRVSRMVLLRQSAGFFQ